MRFRSPAEFIPHGFWLLTDPTLKTSNCGCKYCGGGGKRTQTEISEALGLPSNRGPTAITGGSRRMCIGVHRPTRYRKARGSPSLPDDTPWIPLSQRQERKTDPAWQTSSLKLKFAADNTRILELKPTRRFRIGELVWCVLKEGTGHTFSGPDFNASFWPAIVLECSLESAVNPASSSNGSYSVLHRRNYSLLRLGASSDDMRAQFECVGGEDSILPWQAHHVDLPSFPTLSAATIDSTGQINPYVVALHTGKRLSESWAVCNRFPARLSTPSVSLGGARQTEGGPTGIPDPLRPVSPDSLSMHCLSAPDSVDSAPQRSPARLKPLSQTRHSVPTDHVSIKTDLTTSVIHDSSAPEPQTSRSSRVRKNTRTVTEMRYEGFWYGAERIWIGDIVRLCPERDAFAPSLRLSHMARGDGSWQDRIAPSPGAAMRGVLMRVHRIFVRVSDTGSKECAVAGSLYEVASQDWMDTEGFPAEASQSSPPDQSSVSHPPQGYHPWDMPTTPPPRPSGDSAAGTHHWPNRSPSLLDPAPSGYTLRPLLPPDSEIALPAHFIAGRYYPDILQWQAPAPVVPQVPQAECLAAWATTRGVGLLSLCGLAPGRFNRAVCVDIRLGSRTRMIEESAYTAGSQHKAGDKGNQMDVDG